MKKKLATLFILCIAILTGCSSPKKEPVTEKHTEAKNMTRDMTRKRKEPAKASPFTWTRRESNPIRKIAKKGLNPRLLNFRAILALNILPKMQNMAQKTT